MVTTLLEILSFLSHPVFEFAIKLHFRVIALREVITFRPDIDTSNIKDCKGASVLSCISVVLDFEALLEDDLVQFPNNTILERKDQAG